MECFTTLFSLVDSNIFKSFGKVSMDQTNILVICIIYIKAILVYGLNRNFIIFFLYKETESYSVKLQNNNYS